MSRIYITSLNAEIKKEIADAKYSLEEMKRIRDSVSEFLHRKNKTFRLVFIISTAIAIILSGLTIMEGAPIIPVLITIPCFAITMGFSYFLSIGNFQFQYNRAVKKGYPEYEKELCL